MALTDEEFLIQFERKTLQPEAFDHYGHLRLAWLYLTKFTLDQAIAKTTQGIQAYAESLGATGKFHHTLTEGIVRIMHQRLLRGGRQSLESFLAANPDLVEDIRGEVLNYYSEERLDSESARRQFRAPDIRPFAAAGA